MYLINCHWTLLSFKCSSRLHWRSIYVFLINFCIAVMLSLSFYVTQLCLMNFYIMLYFLYYIMLYILLSWHIAYPLVIWPVLDVKNVCVNVNPWFQNFTSPPCLPILRHDIYLIYDCGYDYDLHPYHMSCAYLSMVCLSLPWILS
jgi:hypothetical protein